jgi:hypothetical protein
MNKDQPEKRKPEPNKHRAQEVVRGREKGLIEEGDEENREGEERKPNQEEDDPSEP